MVDARPCGVATVVWRAIALLLIALPVLPCPANAISERPAGLTAGVRLSDRSATSPTRPRDLWMTRVFAEDLPAGEISGNREAAATLQVSKEDPAARVSPSLAFLLSALLPGTGQLAEGRNRAFIYLGAEVFAWVSHISWKDASRKKEGESETYADRHWSYDEWTLNADNCLGAIPPGENRADLQEEIQSERESDPDAYYESLAEEDGYRGGWDDFACETPEEMTASRSTFSGMREDSDDFLERARMATTLAFLNRIVSAVDAYRTARGARLALTSDTNIELDVRGSLERPRAMLRVRKRL